MKKKGIALLITIILLAMLSLLLLKNLSISERFIINNHHLKTMASANRLYLDTKQILHVKLHDLNSTEAFALLFAQPISFYEHDFKMILTLSPLENRLNINHLFKNGKINEEMLSLLEDILNKHRIVDTHYFIDLLLDTLDSDHGERSYKTEIILYHPFFANTTICSREHFMRIVDYYAQEKNDYGIYDIEWGNYIGFYNEKINLNFTSLPLLRLLLSDPSLDSSFKNKYYESFEDLNLNEDQINYLKKLNVSFETSKFHVAVEFDDLIRPYTFEFDYSHKNGTSENVKYSF